MKTIRFTPLLVAASIGFTACLTVSAAPAKSESSQSRTVVNYEDPENFTDMKDGYYGSSKGLAGYQEEFARYIKRTADRMLPEGQTLEITFTDVDMAGDFEPWRGASATDVRIVKSLYPPRLTFNYVVRDSSGAVVKEGSERLVNLSFMQTTMGISRNDTFHYEQEMMRDWLRELRA